MPIDFQLISKEGGLTNRGIANWTRGTGGFTASFDVKHRIDKGAFTGSTQLLRQWQLMESILAQLFEVQVRAVGIGFPVKKSAFAKSKSSRASSA